MKLKLTPKNWSSFQHYRDRKPAWIKLHHSLLDDFDFHCLPLASRALAPCLWLLASEYQNGTIEASVEQIAFRIRSTPDEVRSAIIPLIEKGFFSDASGLLAGCYQNASLERERETEIEEENVENTGNSLLAPFAPNERSGGPAAKPAPKPKSPRGSRLPDDWKPSEADIAFADERIGRDAARTEFLKFKNYWTAKAGASAVKVDWGRTWRNWILTAAENRPKSRGDPGGGWIMTA